MRRTKQQKRTLMVYIGLRVIAALFLGYSIFKIIVEKIDEYESMYFVIATNSLLLLLLSFAPSLIERKWKIDIPEYMEILFVIFCSGALLVGEIGGMYEKTTWWDAIMHTMSGSLITIFGFSLLNLLNRSDTLHLQLKPIVSIVFVFCFTAMIGVMWEIIEYTIDITTHSNMQRYFNDMAQTNFIGQRALDDTMMDFMLNTLGSLIICIPGYFDLKAKKDHIQKFFLYKRISDESTK